MYEDVDSRIFNQTFFNKIDDPGMIKEAQEAAASLVRLKIRETGFTRKILPPEHVTKDQCTRNVNDDTLSKIVDKEYDTVAMSLNWRGAPPGKYIQGERYEVRFPKISSEKYEKTEAELMAYDYPVTKFIEDNIVKDLQRQEDIEFIRLSEACVAQTGQVLSSTATSITRTFLSNLLKLIDGQELAGALFLMRKDDHDDTLAWTAADVGNDIASELTINGYTYNTIIGHKLVVTIKKDIFDPNVVWLYTDPKYLGNFFILQDMKFSIRKEEDLIIMSAWHYPGIGIGNCNSVAKGIINQP